MYKYICTKCNDTPCETSICPICSEKTKLVSTEVFYCDKCNTPVFEKICDSCMSHCRRIGTDIRPVFAEERLLIEVLLGKPFYYAGKSIWCTGASNYIVDGEKLKLNFSELRKKDSVKVIAELDKYSKENKKYIDSDFSNKNILNFISCNRLRLNNITDEAINYIREISSKFDISSVFVSFSGGKDSTVTSHLVMSAFRTESIIHIYGDTTLEYPTSADYIKQFRSRYNKTPLLTARNNDQDFNNLCEVIGPPSRVLRWCCTIFKTGAITKRIEQTFANKTKLLSFQGIRRMESFSRSKYDRDTESPKIAKQIVSSPIIDWSDFDVWLYILSNQLPFNNAYRQGFSRVGCWCCPNNSDWSEFLSSIYMHEEYVKFRRTLHTFAEKVGKDDTYITDGKWKARQGGQGLNYSRNAIVTFKPCALEENSINLSLTRPISQELYTLFIPFGNLNFEIGNKRLGEVYITSRRTSEPFIRLTGKIGKNELKITVLSVIHPYKSIKEISELIKNQITKFQTCIGCTYCQSVCKYNALKVSNSQKGNVSNETIVYAIDSNKCIGCLECVKHFDGGCYMKKVLRVKKGAFTDV